MTIDDYIPCYPNGEPIFSKNESNELWVMLIEKAYAKIHGGYKQIMGGNAFEILMDLTGCPTTSYSLKEDIVKQMI